MSISPETLARNLAASEDRDCRVEGVAIIIHGTTTPDPEDPLKMPWPKTLAVAKRCAEYVGITDPDQQFLVDALLRAEKLHDLLDA